MKYFLIILLLFPFLAKTQVIADTAYYSDGQGGWIKVVNYRNSATTIFLPKSDTGTVLSTPTRLKDSISSIRALVSDAVSNITTALSLKQNSLGFTPYNATNPSGYISSITSQNVVTALGFTPYNATNPSGYISAVPAQTFASLTGKPTTLLGYGITDAYPLAGNPSNFLTAVPAQTFASLTGKPTTLLGYGITDAYPLSGNPSSFLVAADIAGKQATLVSATNIKTINGSTILGSGDLVVSAVAATSTSGVAATATASGTTTITHNLGRTPNIIRIYSISSFTSNAAATPVPFSTGTWNSTGNRCLYMVINGTTTQVSQTSTVFSIIMVTSAGNQITGVIGNVTPTGFDITWSETGTHTAGNFLWEAQ